MIALNLHETGSNGNVTKVYYKLNNVIDVSILLDIEHYD